MSVKFPDVLANFRHYQIWPDRTLSEFFVVKPMGRNLFGEILPGHKSNGRNVELYSKRIDQW